MGNKNELSKKGSKTSSFGVSKRECHDSTKFYNSNLYKDIIKPRKVEYIDNSNLIPLNVLDSIILGDSRKMDLIPDCSVHLMITSPPYGVGKDY